MKILEIGSHKTIIDDDTERVINGRRLRTIRGPSARKNRYVYLKEGDKFISLSRLIMDAPNNKMVDHINGNTLDNRKENLRLCSNQQNQCNRKKQIKATSSKYKGVVYTGKYKTKRWQSSIKHNGIMQFLGMYETEELAALAYNNAAKTKFGEFAYLNEVQP